MSQIKNRKDMIKIARRPVGYLASPYSAGDPAINAHFQCEVFNRMLEDNEVLPFIPLPSHWQHTIYPRPYQDWIDYDMDIIRALKIEWVLRLNAENITCMYTESRSKGADNEVREIKRIYPHAIIVIQRDDERWTDALQRLYSRLRLCGRDNFINELNNLRCTEKVPNRKP